MVGDLSLTSSFKGRQAPKRRMMEHWSSPLKTSGTATEQDSCHDPLHDTQVPPLGRHGSRTYLSLPSLPIPPVRRLANQPASQPTRRLVSSRLVWSSRVECGARCCFRVIGR